MKTIVETLELQHRALEQEVAVVGAALHAKSGPALRASLDRFETMLTAHLKLEHAEFYPELLKKAEGDAAQQTVELFQQNLQRIADGLLAFFKRWRGEIAAARVEALSAEWVGVLRLLQGRLRDEEKILHPIHRRLFPAEEGPAVASRAR